MKTNQKAISKAKALIKNHQYVKDSSWSDAQPSTEEENKFVDKNGWKAFGEWYLGVDDDTHEETKKHYGFPYGDFKKLHRSGLIAAKQRAAQNHYDDIEKAADELLQLFEKSTVES
jgi:hypothetical protein